MRARYLIYVGLTLGAACSGPTTVVEDTGNDAGPRPDAGASDARLVDGHAASLDAMTDGSVSRDAGPTDRGGPDLGRDAASAHDATAQQDDAASPAVDAATADRGLTGGDSGARDAGVGDGGGPTSDSVVYLKATNTGAHDVFGWRVALSADGRTLAVGTWAEDSAATGVGGNQGDNSARNAGAVYVYVYTAGGWHAEAYLKASNAAAGDKFGRSIALSSNGDRLLVGAPREDSAATGINGDESDNSAPDAGAAYLFARQSASWSQIAYIKASNAGRLDRFGDAVAISADGLSLAVAADYESSNATGVDGDPFNNQRFDSGAVYVFVDGSGGLSQQAYLKAAATNIADFFGWSLAFDASGDTLAVGAIDEDSAAIGINGDANDDSAQDSGAAYIFVRNNEGWSQQAYIKASNTGAGDSFGRVLDLSSDGDTLVVGTDSEASDATGVDGRQGNDNAPRAGAAYVFTRNSGTWTQQAYIKASNANADDGFAASVSLSGDGSLLAVGAPWEKGRSRQWDQGQNDNQGDHVGAVYLFDRQQGQWQQRHYVKAFNADSGDWFGLWVNLSRNGNRAAVGAMYEASGSSGLGGDPNDNSTVEAGAVYIFTP